jgi:2OG-Fe(II) oxygenase superfamily
MSSMAADLAESLSTVRRPGDFFTSGTVELLAPRLEVDGVGPVALPLLPVQAEQLVAVAERAPFGRGEETLIDMQIRRTWQIGADRVQIGGKHWARTLEAILARVADGLGVAEPIVADLYKLLVYDQGSFFVSHRDTEKVPGMFATLVVVLPSTSSGGELVVRHKGREVRLDLRCEDPSEATFAAFHADCVHEVLPVISGCRLTLVYNLLRKGKGPAPQPPSYDAEQTRVAALLQSWTAGSPDEEVPEKVIYPLEHAYTPAELAFAALKGVDAAVAGLLVAAAAQSSCELHLALLSIQESGTAEYADKYGSYRGRWSEPDLEVGEVIDRHVTLSEWRRPDGGSSSIGELPVDELELSPPDAFDDLEPDDEEFHEATGNEGASFDRSYSRAALVLWRRERFFAVLSQAGLPVTLPYLDDVVQRWSASGEDRQSPLWRQAHDLSAQILSSWPTQDWDELPDQKPSAAARMLALLTRLEDTERIAAFVERIAAGGCHHKSDNDAVIAAVGLFSAEQRAALIERIVVGTAVRSPGACADLLNRAVAASRDGRKNELVDAVTAMVGALPGNPARAPKIEPWQQRTPLRPGFVVDLFTALAPFDEALAQRAAAHILAWPKTYGLDSIVVPAVRGLMKSATVKVSAAVERLRVVCIEHLRVRVAEPLEAPKDWRRESGVGCACPRCGELSRFLADPERKTWVFKAAEADRRHVEETIKRSRCDLDTTTERRGRPYGLVCAKNQASYERRSKQRARDLADLDRLNA